MLVSLARQSLPSFPSQDVAAEHVQVVFIYNLYVSDFVSC